MSEADQAQLPAALVKRIVKAKLSETDGKDYQVNKDALLAFNEAGRLFIHYLTATANDICKDGKRQTISADDVLTALADLELPELVEPLQEALEAFKLETKEKNKKKAEATKKRKAEKETGGEGDKNKDKEAPAAAAGEGEGEGEGEEKDE
jgi:DNA polymerase epsilon subunit 3